jgi:hypothetical protein
MHLRGAITKPFDSQIEIAMKQTTRHTASAAQTALPASKR